MFSRRSFLVGLPAAGALLTRSAFAQVPWPDRSIRFIVPVAAGAGTDLVARQVSMALNKMWNTASIVDNKPGAGGALGTDYVAKAAPDGYTLLVTFSAHYTTPLIDKTPYDPVADFEPIARLASSPLFMVTAADSPFRSAGDVLAASRRSPRSVTYASAGQGTPSHMSGALLESIAGIQMVHAPYKNGSQAMIETGNGQVNVAFSGAASLPLVKSGRLRLLAITSATRSAHLPDVPTLNESAGIQGYELSSPIWAMAPRGTPDGVRNKLSDALGVITAAPEFKALCASQYLEQDYQSAALAKTATAGDAAHWRRLVQLTKA
ncbi:MAG TPA: tripartite tricarboxylate transporter substrate binding protein [Ramlibacter sp.]|nr:tripartite tricarboxylate transporter substrate binding protein [Ramlibacter sp.]